VGSVKLVGTIVDLVQTLIGATAAILGGLIAAWWQGRQAARVARRVRRGEREDKALIKLNAGLSDVQRRLQDMLASVDKDPQGTRPFELWDSVRPFIAIIQEAWDEHLSAKIEREPVLSRWAGIVAVLEQADEHRKAIDGLEPLLARAQDLNVMVPKLRHVVQRALRD
jgi:hypothetical protein